MLFNSAEFLVFFPLVTALYFLLPHRFRWALLLLASCIFYMAFVPVYIAILGITIVIDYSAGILIEDSAGGRRKSWLVISIISTCLVLFVFKYFNFFNANLTALAGLIHWNYSVETLKWVLPIGLSFHTFQSLSYVIEVYRGHQKTERHFGIYSLYVMFYPQLVAGPIERPQNLLHQFRTPHFFDDQRVANGLKLMAWGLFKKVVIADRLAIMVNNVYNNPTGSEGLPLVIATVFFAFQIYCDFSGYSDMAIGAAQVMGFRLMENFNRPYFSRTIADFWKRWHISLSTWFRDYLYIPLGGNRVTSSRRNFNLFLTFLVSGFWHGANWTFIIWGALHGTYLVLGNATRQRRERFRRSVGLDGSSTAVRVLQVGTTFALVCFAWIFFRSRTASDAWYIATHLFSDIPNQLQLALRNTDNARNDLVYLGAGKTVFGIAILSILAMEGVHAIQRHARMRTMLAEKPAWVRWPIYYGLVLSILYFGVFNKTSFIYFQF
ncbi:MAG: MBOAT family protein [Gemmatimonadaceae bacterium]|nr:MBOAT family protein [Gemmatimonadaceae bacterium]MBA3657345.1 MBOAT family protein [Gemmatimonadaceae bacterium]